MLRRGHWQLHSIQGSRKLLMQPVHPETLLRYVRNKVHESFLLFLGEWALGLLGWHLDLGFISGFVLWSNSRKKKIEISEYDLKYRLQ